MTKLNSNAAKIWTKAATVGAMVFVAVQLSGCAGMGPRTVDRDRFDYVSAISKSWKRQTLLNLLKARYLDAPVFMDVSSVISQYVLEGEIELGFTWQDTNTQTLGGSGKYTDRPTITYNPLMGEKFTRSLLRPIPIAGILLLIQAGYPADYVLRICAQTINGLKNRVSGKFTAREAAPAFYELLTLLRQIQEMDGVGMRVKLIDNKETVVMFFREPNNEADTVKMNRMMQLLGLDADVREFRVVYGNFAISDTEIAILSRSMIQIMTEYASYIDVPESDITEGRVDAVEQESAETEGRFPPLIRVRNGTSKPDDAFVAVPYRDCWFWIDDRDTYSKSTFYFLMVLFSSTEREVSAQAAPILTVPTH